MARFFLLLAAAAALTLSGGHCDQETLAEFSNGNREFSAAVYQIFQSLSPKDMGNFLVSPISVSTVMALAAAGANGQTLNEITRGLQLPADKANFLKLFSEITPLLKGSDFYALSTANRIFVQEDFGINSTYADSAQRVFGAGIANIDFKQANIAARGINQWVEARTAGKIRDLLSAEDLSPSTRMLLVNALYFKGKWMKPFDSYDTSKQPFFTAGGQESVDMMLTIDGFNYYENRELNCKYLEMYYEGGEVSMVFVLPNEKNGLSSLENHMGEVLKPQPYRQEQVRVVLPLFSMDTTIQFKPILQKLGIRRAFTTEADLKGIGKHPNNLYIDKIIQKTFINVTEKGTEAAAATAGGVVTLSIPPPEKTVQTSFIADHPFIMYIQLNTRDHRGDFRASTILFAGRYVGPKH